MTLNCLFNSIQRFRVNIGAPVLLASWLTIKMVSFLSKNIDMNIYFLEKLELYSLCIYINNNYILNSIFSLTNINNLFYFYISDYININENLIFINDYVHRFSLRFIDFVSNFNFIMFNQNKLIEIIKSEDLFRDDNIKCSEEFIINIYIKNRIDNENLQYNIKNYKFKIPIIIFIEDKLDLSDILLSIIL